MSLKLTHKTSLIPLYCILSALSSPSSAADNFDSIFSIHTERTPYCPPNYSPDANYIGCCWGDYQTVTSAKGPDGAYSPGCCYQYTTCTGAPPIMYDWTTNGAGQMEVVTPGADAATTTVSRPKPTNTADIPQDTSSPTANTGSSPTGSSPTQSSGNNPTGSSSPSSGGGLSPGAIAGIVVSIACSVISLIFGIWFRFYKLKRKERNENMQQAQQQRQDSWKGPISPEIQTPSPPPPAFNGGYVWPQPAPAPSQYPPAQGQAGLGMGTNYRPWR